VLGNRAYYRTLAAVKAEAYIGLFYLSLYILHPEFLSPLSRSGRLCLLDTCNEITDLFHKARAVTSGQTDESQSLLSQSQQPQYISGLLVFSLDKSSVDFEMAVARATSQEHHPICPQLKSLEYQS
jgi:hypothetical protein